MFCDTTRCGCECNSNSNSMSEDVFVYDENSPVVYEKPSQIVCTNPDMRVPAGEARTQPCDDFGMMQPRLAQIQFPIQQYQVGFCPCEALETGTLFPELVS